MNKKVKYIVRGFVYGNLWGGGEGAYPSIKVESDNRDELISECNKLLESGGLDSGMGYESLIGALLEVETITTIEHEGKEFSNSDFEFESIGNLTDKQLDFLHEVFLHQ